MSIVELIGIILIGFGLIYIILRGFGKISDEIATFETQILKVKGGTGLILIAFGIFILVVGTFFAGEPFLSPPTPTPSIMPTPTPATTTPPTPTSIIDTMNSTSGWEIDKDDKGSSINIKSVPGRTGNAIEIAYDLKEEGWVDITKKINPEILSGKDGLIFFYKGSGEPNTLELSLIYGDVGSTIFGVSMDRATVTEDWVSIEVPYTFFNCWWPDDNCLYYGNKLDLKNVRKIEFSISNDPEADDVYGPGRLIIDDVQGITS